MKKTLLPLCVLVLAFSAPAFAGSITLNFEQYPEFTQITNQYAADNVTFTNAMQLVAPGYDYYDYPPHSGSGVITNDDGFEDNPSTLIMTFTGDDPHSLSGWFSAPSGITIDAYDSSSDLIATFTGSTNQSNAEFMLDPGTPIAYVTFNAAIGADGLTLDDLTYTPVPEPGTLTLICTALLAGFGMLLGRRKLDWAK
jgi:hypothetical protein